MRRAACCCGKQLELINSTTVSVTIYVSPAASDDSWNSRCPFTPVSSLLEASAITDQWMTCSCERRNSPVPRIGSTGWFSLVNNKFRLSAVPIEWRLADLQGSPGGCGRRASLVARMTEARLRDRVRAGPALRSFFLLNASISDAGDASHRVTWTFLSPSGSLFHLTKGTVSGFIDNSRQKRVSTSFHLPWFHVRGRHVKSPLYFRLMYFLLWTSSVGFDCYSWSRGIHSIESDGKLFGS
jgi:hypothetical protein